MSVRVLIADDASVFREVARELLEHRGYEVVGQVDRAAEVVDAVERLHPDAVLLDLRLPDGRGLEIAARLTAANPRLAVLLMSADRMLRSEDEVRRSGARGFVLKSRLASTDLGAYLTSP